MILIDAIYICQSGGKHLLNLLINQLEKEITNDTIIYLIDNRIKYFYSDRDFKKNRLIFLDGNEFVRYNYYLKNKTKFRKVFCFANIPPPIRLECEVMTYFHNILLLDSALLKHFSFKNNFLFRIKGFIIKMRSSNTDSWIVQTKNVKELIENSFKVNPEQIKLFPFFEEESTISLSDKENKTKSFFYPAIGGSHKNHDRLLRAWYILKRERGVNNCLHLTIDKNANRVLYKKIKNLQRRGVPVINHGYLSKPEIEKLYAECRYVIHPSLGESFGLVLIEAIKNNCILLAPDLAYVNAVVHPNYFFNANSIESIENSILQAINGENLLNSKIFVKSDIVNLVKNIIK